jgi:polygalacturonase
MPVQAFSVQSDNPVLNRIMIDNSDGDDNGGHNTDAFDVSESNGVTIRNAVVRDQDDCLAVNSGTVSSSPCLFTAQNHASQDLYSDTPI